MVEPGKLVASGRDGAIFEFGPGLVVRRTRDGRSLEREARTLEYMEAHGYPVPHVEEVRAGGTEIVMERLVGPMMMDAMTKGPRPLFANARLLADLHDQLHEIPAPDWLPAIDHGAGADRVLHLDLHPMNVMMTSRGPVVIDWPNAARGNPLTDVGFTYVLLTCPDMPGPWIVRTLVQPFRLAIAKAFVRRYRGPALPGAIVHAAELKRLDRNMAPNELAKIRRLELRTRRRAGAAGAAGKAPG
jgi:aminoglycoside phosphotransferase (APT) family kinase protein